MDKQIIWVNSIFGMNGKTGLVGLHYQDMVVQLDLVAARELAMNILRAAEAADQDQFIYEFGTSLGGRTEVAPAGPLAGMKLLHEYRKHRTDTEAALKGERSKGDVGHRDTIE